MRVLSWNLFHGRSEPGAGRDLQVQFAERLAGWEWDVAALQEVPPWWAAPLAVACGAAERHVLTSRNALSPVRRALAVRWPDVMKAGGGGSNVLLVRGQAIREHRSLLLRRRPERRLVHAVALDGVWVANLHAQAHSEPAAHADLARAAAALRDWAGGQPCVLAGGLNTSAPRAEGLATLGVNWVDAVLARGLAADGDLDVLEAGPLSDHKPIAIRLA